MNISRRNFGKGLLGGAVALPIVVEHALGASAADLTGSLATPLPGEDVFGYVRRHAGAFDRTLYARILGAANEFKEGDLSVGVAAADEASRQHARSLLAHTRVRDIDAHPLLQDDLYQLLEQTRAQSPAAIAMNADLTLDALKQALLAESEEALRARCPGLSSDVIACVVRLMSNAELTAVGAKVCPALPGTRIGAHGYLGARIQPNSPTDNLEDIRWQVFNGWAYGVGDVVLGTNPVSSETASVAAVAGALQDVLVTFGVSDLLPHCVLAHIDVQADVEATAPGSSGIWFQSIAGSDTANRTFAVSVAKMVAYAARRDGQFGFYFETGQGADFTNGHGHGYDMVLHESRKYGFARALTGLVAEAQRAAGRAPAPWVQVNDVAGFIGPEVFRTRDQLVRCCLEDLVMGKLHGLTIGLDVCSTLHMDVSLDDLDWCLDQVMPAHPAYLMALPTKIDPMLGYLTTGFQDHVRLREKFGRRVNDPMARFFEALGVLDGDGRPGPHFGDPAWVYLQYRRRQGDLRPETVIRAEAHTQMAAVRSRGVFLAEGHGRAPADLAPALDADIRRIYADAKESLWAELSPGFIGTIPNALPLATLSTDRTDYILHPTTGEQLAAGTVTALRQLRVEQAGATDVQIVVSDGLNALAITDPGHLAVFLETLHQQLTRAGLRVGRSRIVFTAGRVRAGYRVGEALFGNLAGRRAIVHVIGERPGSGHHTFSAYITDAPGTVWGNVGQVDHDLTKVVSGIAVTALAPADAARDTARLLIAQRA